MKLPISISALILYIAIAGFYPSSCEARTFVSKEGGFTVNIPGNPKKTHTIHKSFIGKVKETTYRLDTRKGNYSVAYSNLSGAATFFGGSNTILKKAKEGLLKNAGGREISFKKTSLEGYPGRILEFQIPKSTRSKKMQGRARLYLVKNRLLIVVGTRKKGLSLTPLERFLNSFRLINQ